MPSRDHAVAFLNYPQKDHKMVREEFVLLSCFVRELSQLTGQPIPYSTRKLYAMALDNEIPVEKRNGRWGVSRQQLPAVAEALALPVPQQHAHAA